MENSCSKRGKRKGVRKRERKSKLSGKYRINDVFSPQDGLRGSGGQLKWEKSVGGRKGVKLRKVRGQKAEAVVA